MNAKVKEEYKGLIDKLQKATEQNKISWKKQNNVTFYFEKPDAVTSLQKVQIAAYSSSLDWRYILMIKQKPRMSLAVQIDTFQQTEFFKPLQDLFDKIEYSIEKENIDFLKGFMENL